MSKGDQTKSTTLARTNLCISIIIILGFIITSYISYHSNQGMFQKDARQVLDLATGAIENEINAMFERPLNISLTMANDTLLKDYLNREEEEDFEQGIQEYLRTYHEKYGYEAIFLVSAQSGRYYSYNGYERVLDESANADSWFFELMDPPGEYALNIDNDQTFRGANEITAFINCRILGRDQEVLGVVGIGIRTDRIQEIFDRYEKEYGVYSFLADQSGQIRIHTSTADEPANPDQVEMHQIEKLNWQLVVESDSMERMGDLKHQFMENMIVILVVIVLVLVVIMRIIHLYDARLVKILEAQEQKRQTSFQKQTEKIYVNVFEADVTHNRSASEAMNHYLNHLGLPQTATIDEMTERIAEVQIQPQWREKYLKMFSRSSILRAYEEGRESLQLDVPLMVDEGETSYWMRIMARIFFWDDDKTVRVMIYRQNITQEKERESQLLAQMERDPLTGLYNKAATQHHIQEILKNANGEMYAFFMLDIDNFKAINDTCGHAFGDRAIAAFASNLRSQFRKEDVVGRVGGDEFTVFLAVPSVAWAYRKAEQLAQNLHFMITDQEQTRNISASIGVAVTTAKNMDFDTLYRNADRALYETKRTKKGKVSIYASTQRGGDDTDAKILGGGVKKIRL